MPIAISIRYEFVDEKGDTSFTKVRVPNGFAIANYQEFAVGMAQLIANVSNARITRAGITLGIDLSGLGLQAVAQVLGQVTHKATFSFNSAVAGLRKILRLPNVNESKVVAGSDALDLADADVVAFSNAMTSGLAVTGGTIQPTNDREDDLTALNYARETFRSD